VRTAFDEIWTPVKLGEFLALSSDGNDRAGVQGKKKHVRMASIGLSGCSIAVSEVQD
jgi:hypothetical protein